MSEAAWARGEGLVLRPARAGDLDGPAVQRALRDGIERGYEGPLPEAPSGLECYAVEAAGRLVGVIGFRRGVPHAGAMTLDVVAIVPGERGHAYGARALLAAERRLARDGIVEGYGRVPRGNGRGLYFMLRCGYVPVAPVEGEAVTWFRRNPALEPHGTPSHAPSGDAGRSDTPRRPLRRSPA